MKNIFIYVDYLKTDYSFSNVIARHLNLLNNNETIDEVYIARSYNKAIELLETYKGDNIIIDLSYNLCEEKTGLDICKYITKFKIPILFFHIHSVDLEECFKMREELSQNGYKEFS